MVMDQDTGCRYAHPCAEMFNPSGIWARRLEATATACAEGSPDAESLPLGFQDILQDTHSQPRSSIIML